MKINKVKNMSLNVFTGFIYRIIQIVFPFIIRTIIIKVLSTEYLGLSSLFTSVLQALNLMEVGLGSALVFNMYEHIAKDDKSKLGNYMAFYRKCYKYLGIAILIMGLVLLPFIKNFITGSYPQDINIYVIYLVYLLNTVFSYLLFAYKNSIALAYQRTDIETKALIISQTLMYIIQIFILFVYKNYTLYTILIPVFTIVKNLIVSFYINKCFPDVKPHGDITKAEKKVIVANIKSLFGHQVAYTVINSADNIIISSLLGLSSLAIYNNYYYIMTAVVNIMTIIFNSIQAGIGNQIILDEENKVFMNYKRFRTFVYIIVCICSVIMFGVYQPFMRVWMGEENLLPNYSALVFSIGFYITQTRRVITTYKNAAGLWKEDILKPYLWIVLDIILDFILIPKIGSIGAMIATSVSAIIVAIPVEIHILYKKVFNKKTIEQYKFMIKELMIYVLCIILCCFGIKILHSENNYVMLIYAIVVSTVIASITTLLFKIKNEDFKWTMERMKVFIKNKE